MQYAVHIANAASWSFPRQMALGRGIHTGPYFRPGDVARFLAICPVQSIWASSPILVASTLLFFLCQKQHDRKKTCQSLYAEWPTPNASFSS